MPDVCFSAGPWNVTAKEYHADRACDSWSSLKCFDESPILYEGTYLTGAVTRPDTPALALGRAVHCAVLEPECFTTRYAEAPEMDRRTKEGRLAWESWRQTIGDAEPLDRADWLSCSAIAEAVRRNQRAADLLQAEGPVEYSVRWRDDETQLGLKARFDKINPSARLILDLKTSDDPMPGAWPAAVARFQYHQQAAFYLEAARQALGLECEMLFLVVGKRPPYETIVYRISADDLRAGREDNRKLLVELALRKLFGNWQSRFDGDVITAERPAWARRQS